MTRHVEDSTERDDRPEPTRLDDGSTNGHTYRPVEVTADFCLSPELAAEIAAPGWSDPLMQLAHDGQPRLRMEAWRNGVRS